MKRLSLGFLGLLLLPMLSAPLNSTPVPAANATQIQYYWFTYPDDTYNDHLTLNDEINEMTLYYGVLVNTNPAGGTLIDRGYSNGNYPHSTFPSAYLYAHF